MRHNRSDGLPEKGAEMSGQTGRFGWSQLAAYGRALGFWAFMLAGTAAVGWMLLWAAGTFHEKVGDHAEQALPDIPTGAVLAEVRHVERPRFETAMGVIQAVHEAGVASKILARVEEVTVTAGQQVTAGEILVKLQDEDLKARLAQLESNQSATEARQVQAQADFDRAERLLPTSSISKADHDAATATLKAANADVNRARQAVEESRIQLAFATIKAPFNGIIVDKQVKPGDTAVPGQVLLRLYDPTQMQLVAQVRESLAMTLRPGQPIGARLDALGYECQATIAEVVPQADSATHSFEVKVTGPCPEGIYSGMFGRLVFPVGTEKLLLAPADSLIRIGQLTMVNVAQDGHMERRNVQIGREVNGDVEVLSGLRAGEQVVRNPNAERVQE
jgi:RND family efflux transporter MFP subunit